MIILEDSYCNSSYLSIIENYKYFILKKDIEGNLYWIYNNYSNKNSFEITKKDIELYDVFTKLFTDISNAYLFEHDYDNSKEIIELNKKHYDWIYNELYNEKEDKIVICSDDINICDVNVLEIKRSKNKFIINFSLKSNRKVKDKIDIIKVKINKSNSKYSPFNIIFLRMYDSISKLSSNSIDDNKKLIKNNVVINS